MHGFTWKHLKCTDFPGLQPRGCESVCLGRAANLLLNKHFLESLKEGFLGAWFEKQSRVSKPELWCKLVWTWSKLLPHQRLSRMLKFPHRFRSQRLGEGVASGPSPGEITQDEQTVLKKKENNHSSNPIFLSPSWKTKEILAFQLAWPPLGPISGNWPNKLLELHTAA